MLTQYPTAHLTITGDLNINLFTLTTHHPFTHFLQHNHLCTTITQPTRIDPIHHSASCIDFTLTTLAHHKITAGILHPPISDHIPILTIIHQLTPINAPTQSNIMSKSYYYRHRQSYLLNSTITLQALPLTTPEDTCNRLVHTLSLLSAPPTQTNTRPPKKSKLRKPWMTKRIFQLTKIQHKLHTYYLHNPTPHNYTRHRTTKAQLQHEIQQAKENYYHMKLDSATNSYQTWKIIKSLHTFSKQREPPPTLIHYQNATLTEPGDIANALNHHFATVGSRTLTQPTSPPPPPPITPP
eukprot:Pompholyxophrys_sp_v1_NODE_17_length_4150_cov_7.516728.p3 type:complete len:296 gc:universal NODE_17_length_4150_cov_7.516728:2518-1631(-)